MLKSLTLAVVLAATVMGLGSGSANAASRTAAATCQAIYEKTLTDSQSDRSNRDAYISCISNL